MLLALPRGIIQHSLSEEIICLFQSCFAPLDNLEDVAKFEREFAEFVGRKHCVAFPLARVALYTVLKAMDLPKGSEIIMPPLTIKGILEVVQSLGLRAVFVDLDQDTFAFDPKVVERIITPNARAMLITPLFGFIPQMDKLISIAKKHDLKVIEDFSQCLGGEFQGKMIGTFGDVGIYSASSIKTLDTFGGGLMVFDDEKLLPVLRNAQSELAPPSRLSLVRKIGTNLFRNFATKRHVFGFLTYPFIRITMKIKPQAALKQTGDRNQQVQTDLPNSWFKRYSSFQAKKASNWLHQVSKINADKRQRVQRILDIAPELKERELGEGSKAVYWQFPIIVENVSEANTHFAKYKIDTATSSLSLISSMETRDRADCPIASKIHTNALFIPSHKTIMPEELQRLLIAVKDFINDRK